MLEAMIFVVFPFCMVFSAVSDTLSMTIVNRVPLLLLGMFLLVAPLTGMTWADIGIHLAAGAMLLTVTFALFAFGGMGGGDAKLIAATGVWMGFGMPLMEYLITSVIFGSFLTLAIVSFRSSMLSHIVGQNMFFKSFSEDAGGVPYGIALGLSGLVTYPASPLVVWAVERLAAQ